MIKCENLIIGYGKKEVSRPLSFEIADGQLVLLSGSNGSGKTTLLRTLAGMQKALGGSLICADATLVPARIPKVRGFTVSEFIRTALDGNDSSGRVNAAMDALGISGMASRDISTLSDGEFQKACIATALVRKASVILLDEPTAFLDSDSRVSLLSMLKELAVKEGITVVVSSHDLYVARQFCDCEISM